MSTTVPPKIMNNVLYITVGLPGSGKSTYAKNFINGKNIEYLSSDELRAVFGKDETDQTVTSTVFGHIKKNVYEFLKNDKNVLVDATSVNRRDRSDYINTAKKCGAKVVVFVFKMDRDGLIARNRKRGQEGGRVVPTNIIDKMLAKYEEPSTIEGIDEIIYV
jgi:predicted kinase